MKLTKQDFENLVKGRVNEEVRRTKANRLSGYIAIGGTIASIYLLMWVSGVLGFFMFVAAWGVAFYLNHRRSKKIAARLRLELQKYWSGFIEQ